MKIIVVDDEEYLRKLIIKLIPLDRLKMTVIGEASNGLEGLELCMKLKPDIILTDIRMPVMDGLTMVEKLDESNSDCKSIIISGYDDFYFAQRAIKSKAYDYILKPVEQEELFRVLSAARDETLKARKDRENSKNIRLELKKIHNRLPDSDSTDNAERMAADGHIMIKKALKYIDEEYGTDCTLEEVAEKLFMNPSYFSMLFKKIVGKNFSEYKSEIRIEKAKELLKLHELKIKEIADILGYCDDNYFIKDFKKHSGLSPQNFRKQFNI
jgi:two-component system, response regulator YesN